MALITIVACTLALLSGTASAVTSYQGDDYSYDYNQQKYLAVCDQEDDGNFAYTIYVLYYDSTDYRLEDYQGSGDPCETDGPMYSKIYGHKTCEDVPRLPDYCGEWAYYH